MKKLLAIMGSQRINKNTNAALDAFLEGIGEEVEVKKVNLREFKINHCTQCDYCWSTGQCIFKDDMQEMYKLLDESDYVVLASPVYFNSVNGMSKAMIDRCQRYYGIKFSYGREKIEIKNKVGIFITTGGAKFTMDQFLGSRLVVDHFFMVINAKYLGNYFVSETDDYPVMDNLQIEGELKQIGENLGSLRKFQIQR